MSIAYDWDLIERLLHEVQNGAGHSFTPRPYAEQHAAALAAKGEPVGDLEIFVSSVLIISSNRKK